MAASAAQPNVIVVLVDDLGWCDLSCQGSPYFETPNNDRPAASGMRFTHGYSACTVCSPSRAALLTGHYPARLHITDWIAGHRRPHAKLQIPDWQQFRPLEAVTVAERLKEAGYATASIGKWHLGDEPYAPEHQGFDRNVGGSGRGQPPSYFSPYGIPTLVDGPAGELLTDREAAEAVVFIEANRDRPFFLGPSRTFMGSAVHGHRAGRSHLWSGRVCWSGSHQAFVRPRANQSGTDSVPRARDWGFLTERRRAGHTRSHGIGASSPISMAETERLRAALGRALYLTRPQRGAAHALERAVGTSAARNGEAQWTCSEARPGGPRRTSGERAWAALSQVRRGSTRPSSAVPNRIGCVLFPRRLMYAAR